MTKRLLLLILLFIATLSFSQNNVQISGQVRDKNTKEELNYCSVVVLNSNDSIITGAVTDDKGYFFIPVKKDSYKLSISFIGYKTDSVNIGYIKLDKFLGTFDLSSNSKMMDGIVVESNSRRSTIDKDIQIITEDMRIGTTDTKDLMSKVPGVSYDRYNSSIKVDNNNNIVILADGVEKNQDYIQNLSPDRIKRIEIIRDPGGRYGLEGYSAIVNVILNKNYVGSELYLFDQLLVDLTPLENNYYLPINRFNGSYNYTYNKINIYASIGGHQNTLGLRSETKTMYENDSIVYEKPQNNGPNLLITSRSINYTVGADYYINPKHTISFESNIHNIPKSTEDTDQSFSTTIEQNGIEIDSYKFSSNNSESSYKSNNSLFYIGKLSNNDRLDASFTFSTYDDDYTNNFAQDPNKTRKEIGRNNSRSTILNIEYTKDFSDKFNTQIGYGNRWKQLDNKYVVDGNVENTYLQTNTRHKFYGYASYSFNKKISAKIGIAGETSNIVDENQDNRYFIFQPLLDFRYKANKNLSFKLKYRSNSDYPSMKETNPFEKAINPRTVSIGNPNLTPSVTHKFSLRASILQGLISIEPYYHISNNYIGQIGALRADGIFEFTYDNVGLYQEKGIETNFTIPFNKKWIWQNSFTYYNSSIENNGVTNSVNDWVADSNLIFAGIKNNGVLVLNYHKALGKQITSLGYDNQDNDYWLFLYQQPFLKKKLTVMVGYFLPLNLGTNYVQEIYSKTDDYEHLNGIDVSLLKNMLIIKATYRLSKGKIKKTEKEIEIEDEGGGGGLL
jgi:hypothetical protein